MDNLKLDCTLAYLNEGIIINEFDMLVESVNNEIGNFSNITESLEIVNEGKVTDAIITFIKNIANKIKTACERIASAIKSFFQKSKVQEKMIEDKAAKVEKKEDITETEKGKEAIEHVQDRAEKFVQDMAETFKDEKDSKPVKTESIKKSTKDLFILEWYFGHTNIDNTIKAIEQNISVIKDFLNNGTPGTVVDIPNWSWNNVFKMRAINANDFIDVSNIKQQYESINKYMGGLEKSIDNTKKLGSEIESLIPIAEKKLNEDGNDEDRTKDLNYVKERLSNLSKDITSILNDLGKISANAVKAKQFATQNYNIILDVYGE